METNLFHPVVLCRHIAEVDRPNVMQKAFFHTILINNQTLPHQIKEK